MNSTIGNVIVRVKNKETLILPDIFNLENQTLTMSIYDNTTDMPLSFAVHSADLSSIDFEPLTRSLIGAKIVRLILSDDRGFSSAYFLNLKVLHPINQGPPYFEPEL